MRHLKFESVRLEVVVHVVVVRELVEVLRAPEGRVEREEDVERLDPRLVDGDVEQGAADVHVRRNVAVEV